MEEMEAFEPEQLSRWFDQYGKALLLYGRQWLDWPRAEDIVQDAFIKLMSQQTRPANVKAWLYRSVRNAAISQLRRQNRQHKGQQRLAADRPNWFSGRTDDSIDAAAAQAAMTKLPVQQREVIVLRIWGGMTLQEVADVVDRPVSTVFSRYRAGLAAIRKEMENSHGQQ